MAAVSQAAYQADRIGVGGALDISLRGDGETARVGMVDRNELQPRLFEIDMLRQGVDVEFISNPWGRGNVAAAMHFPGNALFARDEAADLLGITGLRVRDDLTGKVVGEVK